MNRWILMLFLFLPFSILSQVITTLPHTVGGGVYDPDYVAFDIYGNLYFSEALGNKVIKIDTLGILTTFAGTGTAGFSGDYGPATLAEVYQPSGIASDKSGNIYITDNGNHRIRKINATTGIITTIIGNSTAGFGGDGGNASAASLSEPTSVCFDKYGALYLTDGGNHNIRKVDTLGIITTVAGNGILGSSGDGGLATAAACQPQYNMCLDIYGNLYFGDGISNTIRMVDTFGIISTIAGDSTGVYTYTGDGMPALGAPMDPEAITFNEDGLLIISDTYNNRIRKIDSSGIIHTIAGNGILGSTGDGGLADTAEVAEPSGIIFDTCGNLYIAQVTQPRIRKVTFDSTCTLHNMGVKEVTNSCNIAIYPNPAHEVLHIDNIKTPTKYGLFNVIGIMEQSGTLQEGSNSIDVRGLSSGVYVLTLSNIPPDPLQRGNAGEGEGGRVIKKIIKL